MAMPGLSPAGADLGLGDMLSQQVATMSEEERKKKMAEMQQNRLLGPAGSMAVTSLFGPGASGAGY
jgi:hypothetical protein